MGIEKPSGVDAVAERERQAALGGRPRVALERALADLVRAEGDAVVVGAARLAASAGADAGSAADGLRDVLLRRFRARRPNATRDTWLRFRQRAEAEAQRHDRLTEELVETLVESVDGL